MDEMEIFLEDNGLVDDLIEVNINEDEEPDVEETPQAEEEDNKDPKNKEEELLIEVDEDDEEPDETKKDSPPAEQSNNSDKQDSSNTISSFVNALKEEEILHLEEGKEIKSITDLYDAIQEEKEKYHKEQLQSLPENSYRQALEAVKAGVPIDQVLGRQANVEKYSSIDETSIEADDAQGEAIRKQILTESFIAKGFSQEKAERFVKRSFDAGEDIEDAKDALGELKTVEQKALQQMQEQAVQREKQQREATAKMLKEAENTINEAKEIIPGKKLTPSRRKALYDGMTKGVDVVNGRQVDIINKYLIDGGLDARIFLSNIILEMDYGNKKEALSVAKARKRATSAFEKQLSSTNSAGFIKEEGFTGVDYYDQMID